MSIKSLSVPEKYSFCSTDYSSDNYNVSGENVSGDSVLDCISNAGLIQKWSFYED
jgi:hypothetical protein